MAPILQVGIAVGWDLEHSLNVVQQASFLLSLLTLGICLWIGSLLFKDKKYLISGCLFAGFVATLPSFIFFAARINNDALYQVFAILAYALLILWWQHPKRTVWILMCAAVGLGLLTKSNILPFVPLALVVLALKPRLFWKQKVVLGFGLLGITVLVIGTLQWLRPSTAGKEVLVGNYAMLTNFVEQDVRHFLTFNPLEILNHPYNNPFSDEERRQEFWEYLYRSAFTGEFHFGEPLKPFVLGMLLCSLLLIPFVLASMIDDMRRKRDSLVPLWAGIVLFLLAHLAFRILFPYSSSQDFRYSLPLLIPFAYYASMPFAHESKWLRLVRLNLCLIFIALAAAFVLMIP